MSRYEKMISRSGYHCMRKYDVLVKTYAFDGLLQCLADDYECGYRLVSMSFVPGRIMLPYVVCVLEKPVE